MSDYKTVLGIETSCDETAVAIVNNNKEVLSHKILSQPEHKNYGGVVPEIASRAHLNYLPLFVKSAMQEAGMTFEKLNGIAVTCGPGLIGGLIVGMMMAKAIANVSNKPFIAVNHLEAHALIIRMISDIEFPFLLLIISGGHCQFLIAHEIGKYTQLGMSLDDSLGEAFDKVGKMLGLNYPSGPIIEKKALLGDENAFSIPRALMNRQGCDFSFSGIKTYIRNIISKEPMINDTFICNIAASFQKCVSDILINRLANAIKMAQIINYNINNLVVTGGVAANLYLKNKLTQYANKNNINIFYPQPELCTDNAIMISWVGIEYMNKGYSHSLDFKPRSRWPLENL